MDSQTFDQYNLYYRAITIALIKINVYIVSLSVAYGEVIGRDTHTSVDFQVDIFG